MNPILPTKYFIPDVEAHRWDDGILYLYGSADVRGKKAYCSDFYHVFSSHDLQHWTVHERVFSTDDSASPLFGKTLFAPDCLHYRGKYHLFFCCSDNSEGVATSNSPYGPFTFSHFIEGANGDSIDPAVFVDDDGTPYLYWGQHQVRCARLTEDLKGLVESTYNPALLTEKQEGFHEGISIRKRGDRYYLVYTDSSRGNPTCLGYATGTSPLGPFRKRGIIIDNKGCDPQSWNNHGSIECIDNQWYVFYHRSTNNGEFGRRVCCEPIAFAEDGTIAEVPMTTQGTDGPIDCRRAIQASEACLFSGGAFIATGQSIDAYDAYVADFKKGDWMAFKYLDFSTMEDGKVHLTVSRTFPGDGISLHLDNPDTDPFAIFSFPNQDGAIPHEYELSLPAKRISGIHALYLKGKGEQNPRGMNVFSFTFC